METVNSDLLVYNATDILIRWKGETSLALSMDYGRGVSLRLAVLEPDSQPQDPDGWNTSHYPLFNSAQNLHLYIESRDNKEFLLDSITVLDRTYQNLAPLVGVAAIAVGMTLFVIFSALRERRKT
jgi:hypothetical protein